MICKKALISALQSLPRFVSKGGLLEGRWPFAAVAWLHTGGFSLGRTNTDFSVLSAQIPLTQMLFPAAQSAESEEEAFRGHVGKPGTKRSHRAAAAGLWFAGSFVCARVPGAAGRFLRCVMTDITTGKSSRFGMPWP